METGLKIKLISFKHLGLGVFFLLLSLQFHLLLALPQNSMVADLNHEKNIGREPIVPKKLSLSVKLGGKHEVRTVGRRGGAVGAVGAGGGGGVHGNGGDAVGDNSGGTKSPDGQGGGTMNQNRYHLHHGSNSGTINCIGSSCLVLILFTSFFFIYSM